MKILLALNIFFLSFCLINCNSSQTNENTDVPSMNYSGKIVTKNFINKIGKEDSEHPELYFSMDSSNYFIKFSEGNVLRDEVEKYINQAASIQGEIKNGLWDTNDPNMQSRVGDYIVIYSITK